MKECENDFIASLVVGHIWLGIDDIANENDWVASDGSTLSYFNWGTVGGVDQPDNLNNEDVVHILSSTFPDGTPGKWNDAKEWLPWRVICTYRVPVT